METETIADWIGDALIERLIPADRPQSYCEHLHSGSQPFYVASARPGAFFCQPCFQSGFVTGIFRAHEQSLHQCDACLSSVRGPQALRHVTVTYGLANLIGLLCEDCEQLIGERFTLPGEEEEPRALCPAGAPR
ncbi:MAG: hypothetical protein ACRDU9_01360 [Acidimicrobiia bacterium]